MLASSKLISSIVNVVRVLNDRRVDFLIIGGTAVAYYGYSRQTTIMDGSPADRPDLDIWYNPTYSNYFKLLKALADLGQDVSVHQNESSPDPRKSFFRYEFDDLTLDLLPAIKAKLSFGPAFSKRETIVLDGVSIPFIGLEDLITDKMAAARPKDLIDIDHLRNTL